MSFPLKPHAYTQVNRGTEYGGYGDSEGMISGLQYEDRALKTRIRRLRVLSRTLTTILSIGAFVPIAITLKTFLSTRGEFRDALNIGTGLTTRRNAWSKGSKNWPTYMYFGVAATSLLLNACMLAGYLFSVRAANIASTVATLWEWLIMLGNFGFWLAGVIIYRTEKDKGGVSNDIWGWTCSTGAQNVQDAFKDLIDFEKLCQTQSSSWYIGMIQVGSTIVTVVTFWFVFSRRSVKTRVKSMRV
ncbi:hypothetical protein BT63DRAFT_450217 [Microthyrium microscopicum]|uniref:MARVEL domain-containing protein n=1 Tax=Microthyrium microscopicum TaxID=703497 RepID=A0A6A6USY2_9PEZI|nr:hypothetical protein BT63DRAFT_450217 [Microthyrium microscopicum]